MNYNKLLANLIGPYTTWEDYDTNSIVYKLDSGEKYRISYTELALLRDEVEVFRYLVNLMTQKQIEESKTYLLDEDNKPLAKRIKDINRELDIIRGVVPTPKGYKINLNRAKDLMSELKKLMEQSQ